MYIESKEVLIYPKCNRKIIVNLYETFGWYAYQDITTSNKLYIKFRRDKDDPNYNLLSALEKKYYYLESQKRTYISILETPKYFLLILIFVIPFFVFLCYKSHQKHEIENNNKLIAAQIELVLDEAKKINTIKN